MLKYMWYKNFLRTGDGIRLSDEECDDGNSISRDGCSSTCKID